MSDLLNKASLVMIPSGYKEDVVYSAIPSDGSGDLSFTRASNGTRVNSAGLVEVCPWNLAQYSNDFSNGIWVTSGYGNLPTLTANSIANPVNGLTDAWTASFAAAGTQGRLLQTFTGLPVGVSYTYSMYIKAGTKTSVAIYSDTAIVGLNAIFNLSNGTISSTSGTTATITAMTNGWYYVTITNNILSSGNGQYGIVTNTGEDGTLYIYGAQLNIGSTAKPYFPTTDRLNVPRLTYQNGGGGCPSLLLEKQSTNLVSYSEQFDNAAWLLANGGGTASGSVTSNYGISPDGTQNADRIQLNKGNTGYSEIYQLFNTTNGLTYTQTIWLKSLSGTPKINFGYTGSTRGTITLTTEWQRYEFTYVSGGTTNAVGLTLYDGFDPSTAQSIDVLAWGAQAELSSYPTSYIPTTSASATRVADACSKTGISSLIGQTEGVFFLDFQKTNSDNTGTGGYFRIDVNDGTTSNRILFGFDLNKVNATVITSGSVVALIETPTTRTQERIKAAIAYKANDFVLYVNGVQIGTDTSGAAPSNMANFQWGVNQTTPTTTTGVVNEQLFFKTRLTNAELQSLTTL